MREHAGFGGLILSLCAACSSDGGSAASVDIEGTYRTVAATSDSTCGSQEPSHWEFGESDTPVTLVFTMKSASVVQMTELPTAPGETELCKYTYRVRDNVATLDGAQSCTRETSVLDDTGAETGTVASIITWTKDVFTFDDDAKQAHEEGEYQTSIEGGMDTDCTAALDSTYERVD
jgi:hypothetical protein